MNNERYFDSFSRSLYISTKSHDCDEVLDPDYNLGVVQKTKSLLKANEFCMFSVFNTHLLTDMGKTIIEKHVHNTDAQAVWKDFQKHMNSSSKGATEKKRFTQYVTNTVL